MGNIRKNAYLTIAEQDGCQSHRKEIHRLTTFPLEPLVQVQNNFTEMFLTMPSIKIN